MTQSMPHALASYPSKSTPGKFYDIISPCGGGEPYCTCWGWKKKRNCSHLEQYHSMNGVMLGASSGTTESIAHHVVEITEENNIDTMIDEVLL